MVTDRTGGPPPLGRTSRTGASPARVVAVPCHRDKQAGLSGAAPAHVLQARVVSCTGRRLLRHGVSVVPSAAASAAPTRPAELGGGRPHRWPTVLPPSPHLGASYTRSRSWVDVPCGRRGPVSPLRSAHMPRKHTPAESWARGFRPRPADAHTNGREAGEKGARSPARGPCTSRGGYTHAPSVRLPALCRRPCVCPPVSRPRAGPSIGGRHARPEAAATVSASPPPQLAVRIHTRGRRPVDPTSHGGSESGTPSGFSGRPLPFIDTDRRRHSHPNGRGWAAAVLGSGRRPPPPPSPPRNIEDAAVCACGEGVARRKAPLRPQRRFPIPVPTAVSTRCACSLCSRRTAIAHWREGKGGRAMGTPPSRCVTPREISHMRCTQERLRLR